MSVEKKGLIFDIQRFSLHDGPGVRTTVFMKGCPLRCWWCHNPESQLPYPELLLDAERCSVCGKCVKVCDKRAVKVIDGEVVLSREKCDLCGRCVDVCPSKAISICGKWMRVEEVVERILKDRVFYEFTGGGATISGGEPLSQPDFLFELLKNLKLHGINVCLDTSGFAESRILQKAAKYVDIILYDIKTLEPEKHLKLTGVPVEPILKNLELVMEHQRKHEIDLIVRIPLIMGVNFSSEEELTETVQLLSKKGVGKFELIPYHRFGERKYRLLGREYKLNIKPPGMSDLYSLKEKMEMGLEVEIRISKPIIV
jgi:pyruvate formate lyase activating enzyme